MSFLRPGVIKRHKLKPILMKSREPVFLFPVARQLTVFHMLTFSGYRSQIDLSSTSEQIIMHVHSNFSISRELSIQPVPLSIN